MKTLAPWRSHLDRALHNNQSRPESLYLQLATVRPDGRPANRSIVFRGFLESTDRLKMVTDSRSDKIKHLSYQPKAEICWYFSLTREQFRLCGSIAIVGETESDPRLKQERMQTWQNLSVASRQQFARPPCGAQRSPQSEFNREAPHPDIPLPNFCLLLFDPLEIDRLDLKETPPSRDRYQRQSQGHWSCDRLNP